jgi:hypothetical protein
MKTALLAGFCLSLGMTATAQIDNSAGSKYTATERSRIESERAKEQLRFQKAEEYCYQRFAVNDCLREVAVERRKTLDELRRQEIILNNIDRKLRAGEQLRQLDEKKAAASQPVPVGAEKTPKSAKALTREQELLEEQAYRDKQLKAQQRIEQRDQQRAEKKGQPAAKTLPVPP